MYGSSANGEARNSANNGSISARTSMPPSVGAKKMVIKPFKVQPKVPDNFGLETWETLKAAVNAVYSKSASFISKEELYRAVENLCIHKMAPKIYELLFIECEINIKAKVYSLVDQSSDHKIFLSVVDEVWRDHCEQLNTVRNIFLHLDRSYALTNPGVKLIWEMGNDIFRRFLETAGADIQTKIVTGLLSAIELRRLGQSLDSEVIGRLTRMLITLDMYALKFEQPFLLDSQRFFSAEGSHLISSVDTSRFLVLVDKRLHESSEMVKQYLDLGTKKALFEVVESSLLRPHVHTLIEKGLKQLLDDNRKDDLKRMFLLYERVDSLELLKQGWVSYIRSVGDSLMADAAGQKSFVEEVLDFQERMEAVLRQSFFAQESFKLAMQRSFEHFLNNKPNNTATTINSGIQAHFPSAPSVVASELIAKFLDRKMRGEKGVSESDIEALLDKVMSLFRYLQEKDVFEAFYKKYLAKRLLLGKSSSYDLEKSMLTKLKTECGSNFTAKLEGMFQDVELSRECQSAFVAYCSSGNSGGRESASGSQMELAVQVLTTGYWPQSPLTETLVLPTELSQLQSKFSAFYVNKYQGRRLSFAHSLERCVVAARFPKGKKDLEVSLFQAIVLVCFNKSEQLSFATLRAQTGIDEEELKRTLQSLACGLVGTRVLTKEPRGKEVDVARDVFAVNAEFTNKLFRIKINTIQMKETIEEVQKTHEEVFRDREYQVDAVIVRTMKSRKRLSHALLMSELMTQLRFPAQSADLKKRIESLIERDYLERDKDDSTFYNYLA